MDRENILKTKSFKFAVRIIKLADYLKKTHKAYELASQVFRSGTAIGALVREAHFAESKKDFIHKLHIALKETNETMYWLELAAIVAYISKKMFESLYSDNEEIIKLLTASIKTAKSRLPK
jgi:four helix bundle protein